MNNTRYKSRITFVIEYDATDGLNGPIIKHALDYLSLVGDGVPSNQFSDIPGTGSEYEQRRPTRVLWHAEHGLVDWEASRSDPFGREKQARAKHDELGLGPKEEVL